jgi:hypothetical protein
MIKAWPAALDVIPIAAYSSHYIMIFTLYVSVNDYSEDCFLGSLPMMELFKELGLNVIYVCEFETLTIMT